MMGMNVRYGVLTAAAALGLLLVVAVFIAGEFNRAAQVEVNNRQQFINQSIQLGQVNQALVRAMAVAAVKDQDSKLNQVLVGQGITINLAPSVRTASTPAAVDAAGAPSNRE